MGLLSKVRLLLGDTSQEETIFCDDDVLLALDMAGSDPYEAAVLLARGKAQEYARLADVEIDGITISYTSRAEAYSNLAESLMSQAKELGTSTAVSPVVTGISVSEIMTQREDEDKVPSAFRRGILDYTNSGLYDGTE